jgi:cytochrome b involved in lipid metabolism
LQCDAATVLLKGRRLSISYEEVQKHVTEDNCWVIIDVRRDVVFGAH